METLLLIMVMPEIFFFLRNKFSMVDQLTIVRSFLLTLYGWVLSPYLIIHLEKIWAGIIMLIFTVIITYIFIIVIDKKSKKSIFISLINYLCKNAISFYRGIIIFCIIIEQKVRKNKVPYCLNLLFVNKEKLVFGTLFVFEPYLCLIKYQTTDNNNKINKNFWFLLIGSHLIAVIIWILFTYYIGLEIYRELKII